MKLSIEPFITSSGWTADPLNTITEITEKDYIAGLREKSLMFKVDSAATLKTFTKTVSKNVSDYKNLVFHIYSFRKGKTSYKKASDFDYKLSIGGSNEFYIQSWNSFYYVIISIDDIDNITELKITPLHTDDDYIIISDMWAFTEEMPLDIMIGIKEALDYQINNDIGDGKLIGTVTASAGDSSISLLTGNADFLKRYAVVKIDDGNNSEIHQILENNNSTFKFSSIYDGETVVNDFTGANIFLYFPVEYGREQAEILLPGMVIWNLVPDHLLRGSKLETITDTWNVTDSSIKQRKEAQLLTYDMLIDCEARNSQLIAEMGVFVRKLIAREDLWVNGMRYDIYFFGSPVYIEPPSALEIIPKAQYILRIEVREQIFDRASVAPAITATVGVNIDN